MAVQRSHNVVNLLWTGGWDSTFRLLQLVILLNKRVQPYYILDPGRHSMQRELHAMQNIKDQLVRDHPELDGFVLPTIYIERQFIPQDKDISDAFKQLQDHAHFGEQYLWMAWYAKANGLSGLEVGAERATCPFSNFVDQRLTKVHENGISYYTVVRENVEPEVRTFFRHFHFPIREFSKLDMRDIAIRHGFYHLMELTWFCHHPRHNGKPCGFCTPCTQAYQDGMKFRLPVPARIRYHVRWFYYKDRIKRDFPKLYNMMAGLKRSVAGIWGMA